MNSWTVLLLLDIARGRCLAKRQATEQEHGVLWLLATEGMDAQMLIDVAKANLVEG
ncbi:hypothetical protein LCGC14_0792970 [marine sediment metagenome]|uniref:Uncharacterized protein n=1 Tax=marine sediment metagenome TaxID=412755 RepID=A0A0F9QBU0_9ZZZZ